MSRTDRTFRRRTLSAQARKDGWRLPRSMAFLRRRSLFDFLSPKAAEYNNPQGHLAAAEEAAVRAKELKGTPFWARWAESAMMHLRKADRKARGVA